MLRTDDRPSTAGLEPAILDTAADTAVAADGPGAPVATESTVATPLRRATDRIPGRLAAVVGVAWYVLLGLATVLEPHSDESLPLIGVVLGAAFTVGLVVTAAGLVSQRRWGLLASLGTAVLLVASAVACPLTGHHTFGAWWYGELACSLGLVGVSVEALRRT